MYTFFISAFLKETLNSLFDCFKDKRTKENFATLIVDWVLTERKKDHYQNDSVSRGNIKETS